ncbi:hypothetical protein J8F10_36140 [Gemmata sp. G18]|uniref:DUF3592 domain-containing protein n=1 Tax=Gemmata palustris TaxID=2822762 RepID=A0ABS5C4W9_9BACT|nr:hypothetical protein [Gemmata palustris]MBP3960687.1 hypothetical protein [Gemmata palustris]
MTDHRLGFGLLFLCGGLLAVVGGLDKRRQKRALLRRAVRVSARVVSVRTESTNEDGGVDFHYPGIGRAAVARWYLGSSSPRSGA